MLDVEHKHSIQIGTKTYKATYDWKHYVWHNQANLNNIEIFIKGD